MCIFQIAEMKDLREVTQLASFCVEAMRKNGIDQWDELYPTAAIFAEDIDRGHLYLLRTESLVGCVVINTIQSAEYASIEWQYGELPVWVIHRLMIHPAHQGKGFAKRLMGAAESLAAERDIATVRLDAFTKNFSAVALYRSLGYRMAGEVIFRKGVFVCFEKQIFKNEF
jgi:ribosomal protein S18 acetylase RimI-like enzyme